MTTPTNFVSVEILGKIYKVKCPMEDAKELRNAAAFLDKEMRLVREQSQVIGLDRIAVITALNLAYQLMNLERKGDQGVDAFSDRIVELQKRIEYTLTQNEQLSLDRDSE